MLEYNLKPLSVVINNSKGKKHMLKLDEKYKLCLSSIYVKFWNWARLGSLVVFFIETKVSC